MRLLWLPDVLRDAGLEVETVSEWETRGSNDFNPTGGICHGTGGSRSSTDAGELSVILNGSATAPPPIAQLLLSRNGKVYVVASGRCNHILTRNGIGNRDRIGIEAMNNNTDEPYSREQYRAYYVTCAAICRKMGWPASAWKGHKEHQSEKIDPNYNMNDFRAFVARELAAKSPTKPLGGNEMLFVAQITGLPAVWKGNGIDCAPVRTESAAKRLIEAGADKTYASGYYGGTKTFNSLQEMYDVIGSPMDEDPGLVVTDEMITSLADRIAQRMVETDDSLSTADLENVKEQVKAALREGTE